MTQQHPITPPPELVQQWVDSWYSNKVKHDELIGFIATQAARWGADQELDAVCDEILHCVAGIYEDTVSDWSELVNLLRDSRRPKPPSLKVQALTLLGKKDAAVMLGTPEYRLSESEADTIRRALEQLDD